MAGEVELRCATHKDTVLAVGQPQLAYVLIEAQPTQAVAQVQMPVNFCFVLDQSGSMADEHKIDLLHEAVKYALDFLQPTDLVSIVAFEGKPHVISPSQRADDKDKLKRLVDKLKADDGTEIGPAIKAALGEVRKNREPNRVTRLILLTDGQSQHEEACRREAAVAQQDNIPIIALGLGADWNSELLQQIGAEQGGRTEFIQTPPEIGDFIQGAVRSMQAAVVQNATLVLRLASGVTPRNVWRVIPSISNLGAQFTSGRDIQVVLGELEKDQGQAVLVELVLPARPQGRYRIAQASVEYDVSALGLSRESIRADIMLGFTGEDAAAAVVNARVMNLVERVTAFKLQTRALQDVAAGNAPGATQKLRQAATILLNLGEGDLARTNQLEADRLEQGQPLSEEGRKTIRFKGNKTIRLQNP